MTRHYRAVYRCGMSTAVDFTAEDSSDDVLRAAEEAAPSNPIGLDGWDTEGDAELYLIQDTKTGEYAWREGGDAPTAPEPQPFGDNGSVQWKTEVGEIVVDASDRERPIGVGGPEGWGTWHDAPTVRRHALALLAACDRAEGR